jgi:hypothetical protein
MFKQLDGRIIIGGVIIAVLIIGGIFVYSQWSFNRFADEIGEPPQSQPTVANKNNPTSTGIMTTPHKANTNSDDKNQLVKEVPQNLSIEDKQISEEDSVITTSTTEFDPTQLLSAFGVPEEITTLLDEEAEEGELKQAEEQLKEKFGQSPEVEAIIDRFKQLSGGPVALDDITGLFEDWIQVLPEEDQKTRSQLMNALTQLNQIQESLNQGKEAGSEEPLIIEIAVDGMEDVDK